MAGASAGGASPPWLKKWRSMLERVVCAVWVPGGVCLKMSAIHASAWSAIAASSLMSNCSARRLALMFIELRMVMLQAALRIVTILAWTMATRVWSTPIVVSAYRAVSLASATTL